MSENNDTKYTQDNDFNTSDGNQNELGVQNESSAGNIFDDFIADTTLANDVKKAKEEEKKDGYYYLSVLTKVFQGLFVFLLISILVLGIYIYVQKNLKIQDNSLLDPFCFLIKDDNIFLPAGTTRCSSISYIKSHYQSKKDELKQDQIDIMLENLETLYEKENLLKSKDVTFLVKKSGERLDIIKVLEKFDALKKDFLQVEKNQILCGKMELDTEKRVYTVNCNAFSKGYEAGIIGFSGDMNKKEELVGGTSISVANSFLNYIEKNSIDFKLIDRQKMFEHEVVLGDSEVGRTTGYTQKTPFVIKLKTNF